MYKYMYILLYTHKLVVSGIRPYFVGNAHARGKGRKKIRSGNTCQGFRIQWNVMTSKYRPQECNQRIKVLHLYFET